MRIRGQDPRLSEIAATPTFRVIDGVSICFVESDPRHLDALLFGRLPGLSQRSAFLPGR
jgi:hypothetical protein